MKFEISHEFNVGVEELERVMFHDGLAPVIKDRVELIVDIRQLEKSREGNLQKRRVSYTPYPMIKSVGTKKVEPEWMEWIEESEYDFSTRKGTFKNIPVKKRIADLMDNYGTMELIPLEGGKTRRVVSGELKIKVFMLGKIAEKIIQSNAYKILDEEAAALQAIINEKVL